MGVVFKILKTLRQNGDVQQCSKAIRNFHPW